MEMITYDEAFGIVMETAFETGTETVSFKDSDNRVLAEDIFSDIDMPPFDRAAVDGYACRRSDLYNDLKVIEVIAAGKAPLKSVGKDQCSKIMTGAIVPDGCDIIVMVEESQSLPEDKVRPAPGNLKINISFKGEDVKTGDRVLRKGKIIRPQDIAVIASVGHTDVLVKKMPSVGVMSTGDEIVEPSDSPGIAQIRNSNAYQLLAQVKRAGGSGHYYGIAPDNEDITYEMVLKAIDENDIVILTGGVSMGDFDFVPAILKKAGVKILFDRVRVQPGKPTTFGIHSKALVFGLPGNPVSSFIQFETLVRPLINKMMGYDWRPAEHMLPVAVHYKRKSADRMGWVPVIINENNEVLPVDFHGSAHLSALSDAYGLFGIEAGKRSVEKGVMVIVREI
jgi:molybdopterin molybdotransferase